MVDGRVLKAFRRVKDRLKKGSNARKRTLAINEYLRLIEKSPPHLRAVVTIAYNTGMRAGEIRQLKWSYVDRENGFIRLPKEITKERKKKNIPINCHVMEIIDNIPRALNHPFVITYKGRAITRKEGLRRSFKTACTKAKIPYGRETENGIIFHDIRRTVKTNMLNAGLDKVHRDMILSHSLQGMDVHYMVSDDDSLKGAMDKYTRWIDDQIANVDHPVDQDKKTIKQRL
ncbi:site-specific integrase [Thermodesulfobacteriota bacterium]